MQNASTVEPLHLRACLSRFVTGVVVVSYRAEGELRGLTVNSFTSVSLEPPLVLVSVARSARATGHLGRVPFSVNVLGAPQLDVARHFAGRPRDPVEVTWQSTGDDLAPTLAGALATFRCRPWQSYDGGDHRLHLGHVMEAEVHNDGEPLLFDRGRFSDVGVGAGVGVGPPACGPPERRAGNVGPSGPWIPTAAWWTAPNGWRPRAGRRRPGTSPRWPRRAAIGG